MAGAHALDCVCPAAQGHEERALKGDFSAAGDRVAEHERVGFDVVFVAELGAAGPDAVSWDHDFGEVDLYGGAAGGGAEGGCGEDTFGEGG